eukprot:gb/GECG01013624.1/.p1 GENE.gb/GECG01013624.1/~~gb/GECG01013624.1/.p1  ORF type:complete len:164 (+),score=13.32 gb/GECG01013624.1/:1-492(+)
MADFSKRFIQGFSVLGAIISLYALYVEYMKSIDINYDALCDVNSYIQCSKVFLSEYGHIMEKFGILSHDHPLNLPNAGFGLVFYICAFLHDEFPLPLHVRTVMMFLASALSAVFSGYLAYILTVVLQDFCIVCVSTYVITTVIFIFSFTRMFTAPNEAKEKEA